MNGLVDGLIKAADRKWINDKKAKTILNAVITQLGVDMEGDVDDDTGNEENLENTGGKVNEQE
jgi:hypothetical protein